MFKIWKAYFTGKLNLVFFINPEILAKLFNLIYYLTLTLTSQLSSNPNPYIKYAQMNIVQCSFSLYNIIFWGK